MTGKNLTKTEIFSHLLYQLRSDSSESVLATWFNSLKNIQIRVDYNWIFLFIINIHGKTGLKYENISVIPSLYELFRTEFMITSQKSFQAA